MTELIRVPQPDQWGWLKALVLDSVSSPITRRVYNLGLDEFFAWYGQEPRAGFTKATVAAWRVDLEARGLGAVSINVRITRWCIVDLVGKHGRVRTVPMPTWVKVAIDAWTSAAGIADAHLFRAVSRGGQAQAAPLSEKVVWQLLRGYAALAGVPGIAPHDLRRTCAKLCRAAGGELEQIQLLLGHASIQTTERYLGTKQDLVHAPNDGIKLRVAV
jgi:integrase